MIIKDVSIGRLELTCSVCGRVWSCDDDVQRLPDGHVARAGAPLFGAGQYAP